MQHDSDNSKFEAVFWGSRLQTRPGDTLHKVQCGFPQALLGNADILLPYSMEQSSSWEANRFSVSKEIPQILWNPKVHYRIHKYQPLVLIPSQLDPVQTSTSHFLKIHLNIILPSTPGSPKWYLSLRFLHHTPVYASPLPHTLYMTHPFHSTRFDHPYNIGRAVQIINHLII
jgi:hypothetical protein